MESNQLIIEFDFDKEDLELHALITASGHIQDASRDDAEKRKSYFRYTLFTLFFVLVMFVPLLKSPSFWPLTVIGVLCLLLSYYKAIKRRKNLNERLRILEGLDTPESRHVKVGIDDEYIYEYDEDDITEISVTQINEILDDRYCIVITLKNEYNFVFPKNKLSNLEQVTTRLQQLAADLHIDYTIES